MTATAGSAYVSYCSRERLPGKTDIDIPCEATVRKVMVQIGLIHKPRRKPNGITKSAIGLLENRMIFSDVIFTQTGL